MAGPAEGVDGGGEGEKVSYAPYMEPHQAVPLLNTA